MSPARLGMVVGLAAVALLFAAMAAVLLWIGDPRPGDYIAAGLFVGLFAMPTVRALGFVAGWFGLFSGRDGD